MSTPTPTPHVPSPACPPAIASSELELHYLAEGAANIIYSVTVLSPQSQSLQEHSHCCVMRLRKDLRSTKPAVEVMADFERRISPLFAGQHESLLMTQSLYKLSPEMVRAATEELLDMEHVDVSPAQSRDLLVEMEGKPPKRGLRLRPHHRRHAYLPAYKDEQYGILMQNLQGPGIDWLVEFKPKWLVQSPSAPAGAKNCRTCALNAMRRKQQKHQGRGDSGFCPLDLLAMEGKGGGDLLERALAKIWPSIEGEGEFLEFVAAFKKAVQPALLHLQMLQEKHGSVGLNDFQNPTGKDFGVAMALRDCSVFLALRRKTQPDQGCIVELVEVKFADLDLKSIEGGKIQKWATMEQELLDGGWYYSREDSDCSLSRIPSLDRKS
ncbi:Inositol-pentakisphosphate 2-kinase [Exophiala xenobiotica]|nr:Inositol-pentakisphosphate 2-kinase [Exophiala xenobiotica]KAK5321346.1 Inositol-pentakisphosphate 2-kinase [Exophiala xenobiotica]KAK5412513.1 Inositol-pentakisphosphate 2-kinase [Exophiala xenobiotica]